MKPWVTFAALCIALGIIATCSQGCTHYDDGSLAAIEAETRQALTYKHQRCLMRYRAAQWPNVIHHSTHPCEEWMIGCYANREAASCEELARLGVL